MKGSIGDKQRLLPMLDSISEIEKYVEGKSFDVILENSMLRFASVKQIEIIGEAANHISEEVKNRFTDIQWRQITGLRHVLVHEYFGVDNRLVWQIIIEDIPTLKIKIKDVLASMD